MGARCDKLIAELEDELGPQASAELARAVMRAASEPGMACAMWKPPQVIVCPPFVARRVAEALRRRPKGLGAQNLHWELRHRRESPARCWSRSDALRDRRPFGRRRLFGDPVTSRARRAPRATSDSRPSCASGDAVARIREDERSSSASSGGHDTLDATRAAGTIVCHRPVWRSGPGGTPPSAGGRVQPGSGSAGCPAPEVRKLPPLGWGVKPGTRPILGSRDRRALVGERPQDQGRACQIRPPR
jgi:hypothetical protein